MFRTLASEYGYTPAQVGKLTLPQIDMLLPMRSKRGGTIGFKTKAQAQAWQQSQGFKVTD